MSGITFDFIKPCRDTANFPSNASNLIKFNLETARLGIFNVDKFQKNYLSKLSTF